MEQIDYTVVTGDVFVDMSPDDWIKYCSDPRFLGGKRMSTQHLIGAGKYIKVSDTEITAHYQIRAAHLRWKDEARTQEGLRGHGHGELIQHYQKIDGVWRLAGWKPSSFWDEHEFQELVKFGLTQPLSEL
jgi:scytalone dehydratase